MKKNLLIIAGCILVSAIFGYTAFSGLHQYIPKPWYVVLSLSAFLTLVYTVLLIRRPVVKYTGLSSVVTIVIGTCIFWNAANALTLVPGCPGQQNDCINQGYTAGFPTKTYFQDYETWVHYFGRITITELPTASLNFFWWLSASIAVVLIRKQIEEAKYVEIKNPKIQFVFQRGFTLIEIMLVVSIISLISSVLMVNLVDARKKGRDAKRVGDMRQLITALAVYRELTGTWPNNQTYGENEGGPYGGNNLDCHNGFDTDVIDFNGNGTPWLDGLVNQQIVSKMPIDPLTRTDNCTGGLGGAVNSYGYRYKINSPAGTCGNWFYILLVMKSETNNTIGFTSPGVECDIGVLGFSISPWIKSVQMMDGSPYDYPGAGG